MTEREQLEMAAKVSGYPARSGWLMYPEGSAPPGPQWNPLIDDGDALRLAMKLRLTITPIFDGVEPEFVNVTRCFDDDEFVDIFEDKGDDPCAATRRAIVRAASEIAKGSLTP